MTDAIARAIEIAAQVHADQVDKGGDPYIKHVLRVADMAQASVAGMRFVHGGFADQVYIVGVLHDTIEDFRGNPGEKAQFRMMLLREFGGVIYEALEALTHPRRETYEDYIERVATDPIARVVKVADLTHNMDTGRLPEGDIGEKDFARWDKYRRALVRLKRED
jgi:(p)ppGpp synthase/HD superfamily hydrolase